MVSVITLHPQYVAKSYYPGQLLRAAGFEPVGSRPRLIVPEMVSRQVNVAGKRSHAPAAGETERPTTELFVESTRRELARWASHLSDDAQNLADGERELVVVEQYRLPTKAERLRLPESLPDEVALEVVLHAAGDDAYSYVLQAFEAFAVELDAEPDLGRRLAVGSLCFIPTLAPVGAIEALADFSFLRLARAMPRLRFLEPVDTIARAASAHVSLPDDPALDAGLRVAVFDGGVEENSPLAPWVTSRDVAGV